MSMIATLEKNDLKVRLKETHKNLLHAVSQVGNFMRQIDGGGADREAIEQFLTEQSTGGAGMSYEERALLEQLQEDVARMRSAKTRERKAAAHVDPEAIQTAIMEVMREKGLDLEEIGKLTAKIEIAYRDIDNAAERQIERITSTGEQARESVKSLAAKLPSAEAISRIVAETLEKQSSAPAALPEDIGHRIDLLEDKVETVNKRRMVSTFTSRSPEFNQVRDSLKAWFATLRAPQRAQVVLDQIEKAGFTVQINPKDVGNRLSAMGFIRVVPEGKTLGKTSYWWTPAKPVPEGFTLR